MRRSSLARTPPENIKAKGEGNDTTELTKEIKEKREKKRRREEVVTPLAILEKNV